MNKNIGDMSKEELFELCSELLDVDTDCMLLQRRIDKALEYLKTFHFIDNIRVLDIKEYEKLLEILGDKE